jgi:hypothetical protein
VSVTQEVVAEFAAVEGAAVRHLLELAPGFGVFLGLHEYDGRLPDLRAPATGRWKVEARRLTGQLRAISDGDLPSARRFDRILLELSLESPLFDLEESRDYDRNPMAYLSPLSLTPYLVREYAPVPQRVEAMRRLLGQVPGFLGAARRRLEPHVPEPFVRLAISMGEGLFQHFPDAEQLARTDSETLAETVRRVREPAEAAVREFVAALRSEWLPRADMSFALGPERYQKLLWVREGIRTPFREILEEGNRDLRRNQERLRALARAGPAGGDVAHLLDRISRHHPTADGLLPLARTFVEETKKFVEEKGLVTIPEPAVCRVEETPPFHRALSTASMHPPGPFDTQGDVGIYFVTPVDPQWSTERQEEWLRAFNDGMLRNVTVHEVYPGHYLQFLHFRRSAGTLARKTYVSTSFSEGWAHYAEQLAIEQGLGGPAVEAEIAQLHDALLRDARLLASIRLHTEGWSLAQATALFREEAWCEPIVAEREALRGTFNPEYFCYTLGKLAILSARSRYLADRFDGSLRAFHDRLLSFGCPPVGLLESLLAAA